MSRLPRIAIGTVQPEADAQVMVWALMDVLAKRRVQVQGFLSRACFAPLNGATVVTGRNYRHLDSWLMSPDLCREVFTRGSRSSDLALVEGRFAPAVDELAMAGGSLTSLCRWLDLPRLVVLDVAGIGNCRLPPRPRHADGLLLDRVADRSHLHHVQTNLEALWGIPVLGALEELSELRTAVASLQPGGQPTRELCQKLGRGLAPYLRFDRIMGLANRHEFPEISPRLFRSRSGLAPIKVALAYDEAFHCYFPDALDLLELLGAEVVDFSPLRDERLPPGAEVVYLGGGCLREHAPTLSRNHCMSAALRAHVFEGRRIYAEGSGVAYLCQHADLPGTGPIPMVGALPAVARGNLQRRPPQAAEITLARNSWLGAAGSRLRGYLNSNWTLEPAATASGLAAEQGHEFDLMGDYQALGSQLCLNFVTQPERLLNFFRRTPARSLPSPM
ncbi:MAG: hypothetical protein ACYC35_13565 [Pirellulales bacterium]